MAAKSVDTIGGLKLEQRHGKSRVRVGRVWKDQNGRHHFVEWNVSISLFSNCLPAYVNGDNSDIVATDTMKNTFSIYNWTSSVFSIYLVHDGYDTGLCQSQRMSRTTLEDFAIILGKHFTSFYRQVTAATIKIEEKPWARIHIDGQPHEHGFKLGSDKHTTQIIVKKLDAGSVVSGIEGLALLKTTQSGFEGFIRDKNTILPETRERMLETEVTASWRYSFETLKSIPAKEFYFLERYMDVKKVLVDTFFGHPEEGVYTPSVQSTLCYMAKAVLGRFPDKSSVQLKMPNIHFQPVNLSSKDNPVIMLLLSLMMLYIYRQMNHMDRLNPA